MMQLRTAWVFVAALAWAPACERSQTEAPQSALPLALNELLAKPSTGDDWIEIINLSDEAVLLEGAKLVSGGDSWSFPAGEEIAAAGYAVVYCDGTGADGKASFKLSSSGETVALVDSRNHAVDEVTFGEQQEDVAWGRLPNGTGEWQALRTPTPGAANTDEQPPPPPPGECLSDAAALKGKLVLNELLSNGSTDPDWIELFNAGADCIDLSGLTLTDDKALATKWAFPTGTQLEAGKYLVIYADESTAADGKLHAAFKLSSDGEELQLADAQGSVVVDAVTFPALDADTSYGRVPDGSGAFKALTTPTPGAANQDAPPPPSCVSDPAALKGQLVINELFAAGTVDPDWIELFNAGTECIQLDGFTLTDDPTLPAAFAFPAGTRLRVGAYLLVYADASTAADGKLHAPFKLSAGGEELQLAGPLGTVVVDTVAFPAQDPDTSYGRSPDGTGAFQKLTTPTPGAKN